jgi:hypothetical protein
MLPKSKDFQENMILKENIVMNDEGQGQGHVMTLWLSGVKEDEVSGHGLFLLPLLLVTKQSTAYYSN